MFKKLFLLVLVLILVGVAVPISNIVIKPDYPPIISSKAGEDTSLKVAGRIFEKKCLVCHAADMPLPFYANFPLAKTLIQKDISDGIRAMDMSDVLNAEKNNPINEVVLAKIEYSVDHNTMPPIHFLALHWDGRLTEQEKMDVASWVYNVRKFNYQTAGLDPKYQNHAAQPLPQPNIDNPAKVALGDKMFHDVRLSHDNTLSCASCHDLKKGGTDQKEFSTGIFGQVGDINSPTVFNSGFNFVQFWDGRAASLEEQADGPVNNPIEMGSNWAEVTGKLVQDATLVQAFAALYPQGITKETVIDAIATFERSLVTSQSRFDKYLKGDDEALSAEELQGYQLFRDNACATCHVGKSLGGQSFEKMGHRRDYFADRGNVIKRDNGRFNVTNDPKDMYFFKVPTLRNITLTAPYFHDATAKTLEDAVRKMAKYQSPREFNETEIQQVVLFLKTLTGQYLGKDLE